MHSSSNLFLHLISHIPSQPLPSIPPFFPYVLPSLLPSIPLFYLPPFLSSLLFFLVPLPSISPPPLPILLHLFFPLVISAKHHQAIAEIYESEMIDLEKAMQHYRQAADYFKGEESSSSANKCLLKVAQYAAQMEKYEQVGLDDKTPEKARIPAGPDF